MITNTAIKALQPGKAVWDTLVPGLHVRATATRKSFYLFFRTKTHGTPRRPKLGDAAVLEIGAAREIARAMLAEVAAGKDPIADRAAAKLEPTMDEHWARCWTEHYSKTKDSRNVKRLYETRVAPRLGSHRVRAICYSDVHGLHSSLAPTPYEANRVLALVSRLLGLAERHGTRDLGSNPCGLIQRFPELKRKRFATREELIKLGAAFDKAWAEKPRFRRAVTFLALIVFSGMRPKEVRTAKRAWIERDPDGAGGVLRLPDSKTGQRDVYLSQHALALIDRLPAPRDGTLTGIGSPAETWDVLRTEAGFPDLRVYDLRRTFATVSLAAGCPIGVIGEVLGHKTLETTKIYARLMSEPAAELVTQTGDRMRALLEGPGGN